MLRWWWKVFVKSVKPLSPKGELRPGDLYGFTTMLKEKRQCKDSWVLIKNYFFEIL